MDENGSRQQLFRFRGPEMKLAGCGRFPKEECEIRLWHTILPRQSLVCYTFVPQRAKKVDAVGRAYSFFRTQGRRVFKNCLPDKGEIIEKVWAGLREHFWNIIAGGTEVYKNFRNENNRIIVLSFCQASKNDHKIKPYGTARDRNPSEQFYPFGFRFLRCFFAFITPPLHRFSISKIFLKNFLNRTLGVRFICYAISQEPSVHKNLTNRSAWKNAEKCPFAGEGVFPRGNDSSAVHKNFTNREGSHLA